MANRAAQLAWKLLLRTVVISRWRLLVVAIVIGLCLWSLDGARKLQLVSDPSEMLRTHDPVLDELAKDFQIEATDILIVLQAKESILQPELLRSVHTIHQEIQKLDGVSDAFSLFSLRSNRRVGRYVLPLLTPAALEPDRFSQVRDLIATHPLAEGQLLSRDGKSTLIVMRTTSDVRDVDNIENLAAQTDQIVVQATRDLPATLETHGVVTGFPVVHAEIHRLMEKDQFFFNLLGVAGGALLGWILLKRLACVVCVAIGPMVGVCLSMGLAGAMGVPITIINSTMPLIILIVGYSDAIHLVLEVRRRLMRGLPVDQAVTGTLRELWMPCLMTSATTAVGFGSLLISRVGTIRDFGLITAIGCMINYFCVLIVVPLMCSYAGHLLVPARAKEGREPFHRAGRFVMRIVHRWAVPITVAGVVLAGLSLWTTTQLPISNRLADSIPENSKTYQTFQFCEAQFGGAAEFHTLIEWNESLRLDSPVVLAAIQQAEKAISKQPRLGSPLSVLDILRSLPDGFHEERIDQRMMRGLHQMPASFVGRVLNEKKRRTLVTFRAPDLGVDELQQIMTAIEHDVQAAIPADSGIRVAVVGPMASTVRDFQQLVRDILSSLLTASIIIFALMAIATWSIPYGLLSTIPNGLALLAGASILYFTNTPIQFATLICFTICLGVSVDNTIHFLARYQLYLRTKSFTHAIQETLGHIAPPLMITTMVFMLGFGIVRISHIPVLQTFSWVACACLFLSLLSNIIFLPSFMVSARRLFVRKADRQVVADSTPGQIPLDIPAPHHGLRSEAKSERTSERLPP